MGALKWWLRIVGTLYVLEGGGVTALALADRAEFGAMWASTEVPMSLRTTEPPRANLSAPEPPTASEKIDAVEPASTRTLPVVASTSAPST